MRLSGIIWLFIGWSATAVASEDLMPLWPGADYDPDIPTVEQVLGHVPGTKITRHQDVLSYFEALANAVPSQVTIVPYATSWQGRELVYVVLSSEQNQQRLTEIKQSVAALANPSQTNPQAAADLIQTLPAVVWLAYGVHGNEISSTDAAMLTAYHLLASRGDPRAKEILGNTLVILDPMQNPDGRDRFIHHYETARGLLPDSDLISAEHNEPWPGGRTNHYLFDMNRDWFIQTQPETQGRVAALLEWYPLAFVDLHEMGSNATYYFAPEAIPYNPHLADAQRGSLVLFGKNNARWFDQFGLDYFTREVYDAFYPGYGASWPSYFGSIAMTYEQASARGLVVRRYDGTEMSFRDTVRNHFVTSLSTAEVVSNNREKFLQDFYEYRQSAIAEGRSERVRSYIIPKQTDHSAARKLAGLLVRQGVEVEQSTEDFSACGSRYAAGSFFVNLDQPTKRLIRNLMDKQVALDGDFAKEQERRRGKRIPDEIYDVTAWSLPLMFNVRTDECNRLLSVASENVDSRLLVPAQIGLQAKTAYLVPWGTAGAARLLTQGLLRGLTVKSTDLAFTHKGQRYPAGTLIFDVADNPSTLHEVLSQLAENTGASVVSVDDSWVTDGPNFGSNNVVAMTAPKIAIAWDTPVSGNAAGNTRFVIERQFDYPVTAIRMPQLARADLSRYQVLILPETWRSGSYQTSLGEKGIANLTDWVKRGGVLVTTGNATRFAAHPDTNLLDITLEDAAKSDDDKESGGKEGDDEKKETTVPGELIKDDEGYSAAIMPNKVAPDSVAGVLVNAVVDEDHWLGAGVAKNLSVLVRGQDVYTPIRLDKGVNVARFVDEENLHASGYLWSENQRQLAFKPFVVAQKQGRGIVIGFTQDPNYRAYLDGLNVIFMNAIFRGAAHARPVR